MDAEFANQLAIAPWAHPDLLITAVVTIGTIGSSVGFWEWMKSRRKPTISAEEHEKTKSVPKNPTEDHTDEVVDAAMVIVKKWEEMVTSISARHDQELRKINRRLDTEINRANRLEKDVDALKRESRSQSHTIFYLRTSIVRIQEWWSKIDSEWDIVRQQARPPKFPTVDINPKGGDSWPDDPYLRSIR